MVERGSKFSFPKLQLQIHLLKLVLDFSIYLKLFAELTMASFLQIPNESDFSIHNLPYGVFSTKDNVSRHFYMKRGHYKKN